MCTAECAGGSWLERACGCARAQGRHMGHHRTPRVYTLYVELGFWRRLGEAPPGFRLQFGLPGWPLRPISLYVAAPRVRRRVCARPHPPEAPRASPSGQVAMRPGIRISRAALTTKRACAPPVIRPRRANCVIANDRPIVRSPARSSQKPTTPTTVLRRAFLAMHERRLTP